MLTNESLIAEIQEALRVRLKREPKITGDQIRMIAFKYIEPLLELLEMNVEDLPNSYHILRDLLYLFTIKFSIESYNLKIGLGEEAMPDEFLKTKILEILRKHIVTENVTANLASNEVDDLVLVQESFKIIYPLMYKLLHEYLFNKDPNRPDIDDINQLRAQLGLPFVTKEARLSERLTVANSQSSEDNCLHTDEIFYSVLSCFKLKWHQLKIIKDSNSKQVANLSTCLMKAVKYGFSDTIKFLIVTKNADPNVLVDGHSPLSVACMKGIKVAAIALLEHGANPNLIVNVGGVNGTYLHIAINKSDVDMARILLEHGADQRIPTLGAANLPLHFASNMRNVQLVKLLISQENVNEVINFHNREGVTPVMNACMKGHFEVVQLLLEAGADLKSVGQLLLMIACDNAQVAVVEFLAMQPCVREMINVPLIKGGIVPLAYAISLGNLPIARILLINGANPTHVDDNGFTPLQYAIEKKQTKIIELLNAEIKKQQWGKMLPLILEANRVAIEHYKSEEYLVAIEKFKLVVDYWRDSPKTASSNQKLSTGLYNLGSAEMKNGDLMGALDHLKEAVKFSANTDKVKYQNRLKECEAAIATYQKNQLTMKGYQKSEK